MINLCFELFDDKIKIVISDQGESFDYETTKSQLDTMRMKISISYVKADLVFS